jgi:hypothetical protein
MKKAQEGDLSEWGNQFAVVLEEGDDEMYQLVTKKQAQKVQLGTFKMEPTFYTESVLGEELDVSDEERQLPERERPRWRRLSSLNDPRRWGGVQKKKKFKPLIRRSQTAGFRKQLEEAMAKDEARIQEFSKDVQLALALEEFGRQGWDIPKAEAIP